MKLVLENLKSENIKNTAEKNNSKFGHANLSIGNSPRRCYNFADLLGLDPLSLWHHIFQKIQIMI